MILLPQNRIQRVVFGLLMSYLMAYGMEVYNVAIKLGYHLSAGGFSDLTNLVFLDAAKEATFMGAFVFLFSSLYGNRVGAAFANKHANPTRDNPYFYQLLRQAGTIGVMCPTMSLVASILFSVILGGAPIQQLPAIWVGTVLKNFPMAFFWNLFAAAPITRMIFKGLFPSRARYSREVEVS
jgi:hypothetical protein